MIQLKFNLFFVFLIFTALLFVKSANAQMQCSDGFDNDGDGLVDYPADPGCESFDDNDERDMIFQCSDGIDNDLDGLVDYPADPGCDSFEDDNEQDEQIFQCSDGLDNDNDGLIDYPADPGCENFDDDDETDPETPQCSDSIDNDGDNLIDMNDPGCDGPQDDNELPFNPGFTQCSDGIDNDRDGWIDLIDLGCSDITDDDEHNGAIKQCSDNIDNDNDGLIDGNDPQCIDQLDDSESDGEDDEPGIPSEEDEEEEEGREGTKDQQEPSLHKILLTNLIIKQTNECKEFVINAEISNIGKRETEIRLRATAPILHINSYSNFFNLEKFEQHTESNLIVNMPSSNKEATLYIDAVFQDGTFIELARESIETSCQSVSQQNSIQTTQKKESFLMTILRFFGF